MWTLSTVPWGSPEAPDTGAWTGDSLLVLNVHWKGLSLRSFRATCAGNRLPTLLWRLLCAALVHGAAVGRRAQSA